MPLSFSCLHFCVFFCFPFAYGQSCLTKAPRWLENQRSHVSHESPFIQSTEFSGSRKMRISPTRTLHASKPQTLSHTQEPRGA